MIDEWHETSCESYGHRTWHAWVGGDGRRWEEVGGGGRKWEEMGGGGRRWEEGTNLLLIFALLSSVASTTIIIHSDPLLLTSFGPSIQHMSYSMFLFSFSIFFFIVVAYLPHCQGEVGGRRGGGGGCLLHCCLCITVHHFQ